MSVWEISGPRGHSAQIETALGSNIKQEKVVLKFFVSCRFLSSLCLFEKSGSSARPFDNRALAKNSATVPEMLILRLVNSYLVPRRRAMRGARILAA